MSFTGVSGNFYIILANKRADDGGDDDDYEILSPTDRPNNLLFLN